MVNDIHGLADTVPLQSSKKKLPTDTTDGTPKKKINSKSKGSAYERKIANLLSNRFKDLLGIEKGFRKSVDSGAFFGGSNHSRTETYDTSMATFGDIICPQNFSYSIECKHYKSSPSFQSIINQNVKEWDTWLAQAEQDSVKSSKKMLLIIKYNNVDDFIFLKEKLDIPCVLVYKYNYCYKLSDWLKLSDNTFFT